jgi:hypothetical protein
LRVSVVSWKKDQKNTRQGYAELRIDDVGLNIKDVAVHKLGPDRGNKVFVSLPAKEYTDKSGEKKYWAFVYFPERARSDEFQAAAVAAIGAHLRALAAAGGPPADEGRDAFGLKP